jgi:large repetitive protein
MNTIVKIVLAALLSLVGLTVVGVGEAGAVGPPVITSLTTTSGTANGGTSVQINGSGFGTAPSSITAVHFGTQLATWVQNSGIKITATSPVALSPTSPVDVTVTNANGTSAIVAADQYTYTWPSAPTVTAISPATGAGTGGNTVTITGTNLGGASAVHFGATAATSYTVVSGTSVTATAPAGTGAVDITVTTPNSTSATSNADRYNYISTPTVTSVRTFASPAGGPAGGGTQVTIDGSSFSTGSTVNFGATPAASVLINSLSSITAVSPAGTGTVDVTVTNSIGTSATSAADQFTYNSTLAIGTGTGGYNTGASTTSGLAATATSFSSPTTTVSAPGSWAKGEEVYLSGFTNGLASGFYTVTAGGSGSFQITATSGLSGTGTIVPSQANSFNAASVVTGGGTIDPTTLTVVTPPASGTETAVDGQLIYIPARTTPTSAVVSGATVWTQTVTTTGDQSATFALCTTGHTWTGPGSVGCATGTINYVPASTGFYVGNQISASGLIVSVVVDTGSGIVVPSSVAPGATFTSVTAAPMANLPSTNSGFTVNSVGGYQAITPVPAGVTLVPGSLSVSGGDAASSGKYIASLCTAAMGYVPGECTAQSTGNFHLSYPYIETSLNAATTIAGGTQLTLPTVTAQWQVTGAAGSTINSYETEFVVVTNVAPPIGTTTLDAYPSDLASFNNQGLGAPAPAYAAPAPRWSVPIVNSGPVAPTITSADHTSFAVGSAGTFTVTTSGNPTATLSETGALPSGVTFTDNGDGTATLAGTPAGPGSFPITITAANGTSPDATQNFTLTVNQAPSITSADHTTFTAGSAGTFTVTTTGTPAAAVSKTGALPSGVTFVDNGDGTATLAGTPAAGTGGTYPLTITAANGTTPNATQSFTLTVDAAPLITSAASTNFFENSPGTFAVTASGFPAPTFSETGALPSGVSLAADGTLSGTPAGGSGGDYPIVITATNGIGSDAVQNPFTLHVLTTPVAPAITSANNTTFTAGTAGTFAVTGTGNPAPTFSATTGTLPSGVTLASDGTLAGTPAAGTGGTHVVTITATNGVNPAATQVFTLTVDEAPAITSANAATFKTGTAGTFAVTATGFPAPTFSETGALPSGVSLAANGTLSGTPGAGTGGTYPITVTATNGIGSDATQSFTLTVNQPPAITSTNSTTFTNGSAGLFNVTGTGFPAPTYTETGALPTGVTFVNGTLAGTPSQTGIFPIVIRASNGVSPDATQNFTLTVPGPPAAPSVTGITSSDGSVTVTWTPGSNGGDPIQSYTATATPGGQTCTVNVPATSCQITGLTNGTPVTVTVVATNSFGDGPASSPSAPATPSSDIAIPGYWMATSAGAVLTNGSAVSYGSPAALVLAAPIVALVPTPDRKGYWMVGSDGGVFSYGDAAFFGSTGGTHLNAPIVGMATTKSGNGYWLVAADGGVFAYGDAAFAGSMGGTHLNSPIVGVTGNGAGGYLLVAADGGVFAFGGAAFLGSAGNVQLVSPVVGIAALPDGTGYYLAAADGGVFAYGAAPFLGSAAGIANGPVVGITGGTNGGYTLATSVGAVYAYGAGYFGNQAGTPTTAPIIGIAS